MGKPPDMVIEVVSDRSGGEEDFKLEEYARIGVPYYVIFDPDEHLRGGVLRVFHLVRGGYRSRKASWLPRVGLGLKLWEGTFEGLTRSWLRWCDHEGIVVPTGEERAEQERQRAERLAAQLRALGIDPEA
jgi:hypothetical protein